MIETDPHQNEVDPRIFFAAERTLLAWIRTGLALMGFGFVVARFGLFLREIAAVRDRPPTTQVGLSLWIGTALVILGVMVQLGAAAKHGRTVQRLAQGKVLRFGVISLGSVVAFILSLLGILMVIYLLFGLRHAASSSIDGSEAKRDGMGTHAAFECACAPLADSMEAR